MGFKSDIEIAQETVMQPITEIAAKAGIDPKYLEQYGNYKAKIDYNLLKETDQPDGKLVFSREFSYDYDHVDIDGDWIFLYNENSCRIYNRYGNLKYEGTFDFTVSKITKGRLPGEIIVTGPQMIQQIKLH